MLSLIHPVRDDDALISSLTSVCFLAGDISPLDVISHIPVFMEENDIPYVFVRSKVRLWRPMTPFGGPTSFPSCVLDSGAVSSFVHLQSELGAAARTKRPTSCVLVVDREGVPYARKLEEVSTEMKELQPKP